VRSRQLFGRIAAVDGRGILARAAVSGARFIVPADDEFPDDLRDLDSGRPLGMWVRGDASLAELVRGSYAFVSPTLMSERGAATAEDLGAGLARAGCTVIAHLGRATVPPSLRGALSEGGRVIAVLRHGLDDLGGSTTADYAAAMRSVLAHGGLVVSAAPWGAGAYDDMHAERARRWRVMTALAASVLVLEGNRRQLPVYTGALRRTWLAVPGKSTAYLADLPNHLLRHGLAHRVRTLADVFHPLPDQILTPHPSDSDRDWRDQALAHWMAQAHARGLQPTPVDTQTWDDDQAGTVLISQERYELRSDGSAVRAVAPIAPEDEADHSGCFQPHRDEEGEYVDCDGHPL
jgi:predicted Rossmann fold nucleotide-binding protein DprA/Smf involved in DNA uptake